MKVIKANFVLVFVFAAVCAFNSSAQQTILSNFYYKNGYSINPAYAGSNGSLYAAIVHRQQWLGVSGAPVASHFNIHTPFGKNNGAGLQIRHSSYGLINNLSLKGTYVYNLQFDGGHNLAMGLSAGFNQNAINYNEVRTQDYSDELVLEGQRVSGVALDADFGLLYTWKGLQVSLTSLQLMETRGRFFLEDDAAGYFNLSRHFMANISYDFQVAPDWTMTPVFQTQVTSNSPWNVEGMLYSEWDRKAFFGLGYRKNAGLLTNIGCHLNDQFTAAYSFELGFGGIAKAGAGTHELMFAFKFGSGSSKKIVELEEKLAETDERLTKVESMVAETDAKLEEMSTELAKLKENSEANKTKIDELENRIEELENRKQVVHPKVLSTDVMSNLIYFGLSGSNIDPASKDRLNEMTDVMKANPNMRIKILGYSCNLGSNESNKELSLKRADKVKAFFLSKGIPEGRLEIEGKGSANPIAPNDTEENRERNRRVEVEIISE